MERRQIKHRKRAKPTEFYIMYLFPFRVSDNCHQKSVNKINDLYVIKRSVYYETLRGRKFYLLIILKNQIHFFY